MVQTEVVEKAKTHFLYSVTFSFFENNAVYEIMCQNNVQSDTPQMTISRLRIGYWTAKARDTHSEYVIVSAFSFINSFMFFGSFFNHYIYGCMFCMLLFNFVNYVFLLLRLCIPIVMYILLCTFCFHLANWHSSATLTEVFPCFFLSCKANARV